MLKLIVAAALAIGVSSPARASFEKGGLLEAGARSAALGGACAADVKDALTARGSPAGLAYVGREYIQAGGGVASQASLAHFSLGGGTVVNGIGLSALAWRTFISGGGENALVLNAGLPVVELPWLALGAGLKGLQTDLGTDAATGFGFDASVFARPPLPWRPWTLALAAGLEDALGELKWNGGLREDLPGLGRLAAAVHWANALSFMVQAEFTSGSMGRETILAAGCEYSRQVYGHSVDFRAGVRDGTRRETAVGGGVGVKVDRYIFDYALVGMEESQGYLHLFSVRMPLGIRYLPFVPAFAGGQMGRVRPEPEMARIKSPYQTMTFHIGCPSDCHRIVSWAVVITDGEGRSVWTFEGSGKPVKAVTWNFVNEEGDFVPSGSYRVQLVLHGAGSYRYLSRTAGFSVERLAEVDETRLSEDALLPSVPAENYDDIETHRLVAMASAATEAPPAVPAAAIPSSKPPAPRVPAAKTAGADSPLSSDVLLSDVTVFPASIDFQEGQELTLGFRLGRKADITTLIYGEDMRVRYRLDKQDVKAGMRKVKWNLGNERGWPLPVGSYRLTVIATDGSDIESKTIRLNFGKAVGNG